MLPMWDGLRHTGEVAGLQGGNPTATAFAGNASRFRKGFNFVHQPGAMSTITGGTVSTLLLDLRTIYAVAAVTSLILGCMQLCAFATGRFERWPLWWGLSSLLIGFGILLTTLRGMIPDIASIGLANTLTWAGYLLVLVSVRSFGGLRPMPILYVTAVGGASLLLLLWLEPEGFSKRAALLSLLLACCDLAVAREGAALAKREKLRSAWILVGLFLPTTVLFFARSVLAITGHLGTELFPTTSVPLQGMAVGAAALLIMRSNALMLLATERSRNQFVALAQHDALTGAMNRNGLQHAVTGLIGRRRQPRRVALLLIDIDHFKVLNDTHGHAAGDEVLRLFADVARSELRGDDIVARQGGDEFAVVLPGLGLPDAMRVADRLRQAFMTAVADRPGLVRAPTLSIGVTEGDAAAQTLDALLREADEALYRSKRTGRDRALPRLDALAV